MLKEFKEFVMRGNVLDLAVAVIIGGAFGKIVSSLVNDILMPLVGVVMGGVDFTGLTLTVGSAIIKYGTFIQTIVYPQNIYSVTNARFYGRFAQNARFDPEYNQTG